MVTVVVVAIVATVAVPGFDRMIKNSRRSTQANQMVMALSNARSEAVKLGSSVSLCSTTQSTSTDVPATPVPACANSSNWATGWIVFVDGDNDGARDANEELISVSGPLTGGNSLCATDGTNAVTSLRFAASGEPSVATNAFRLCDDRGATEGRNLAVNAIGRVGTSTPANCTCP
jgi:type IV fimbrial biogenesis protein FimT